jgi:hypothetical protein
MMTERIAKYVYVAVQTDLYLTTARRYDGTVVIFL